MINSWSLLYDELYGDDEMSENKNDWGGEEKHDNSYYDFDRNIPPAYPTDHSSQQFWNEDGFSMTGNPNASPDTITFGGNTVIGGGIKGGEGEDRISLSIPYDKIENEATNLGIVPKHQWKYNEESITKELLEYIRGTYNQHYSANDQNLQTLDFIEAAHNDGESCCRDNIMKYVSRYDKKGTARRDIMKILHYAVLLMHFNDNNANREIYPQ